MNELSELWDYSDPSGTELKFRKLLPDARMTGDINFHMELLTQIARALGLQKKFDEAHKLLDEIESNLFRTRPIVKIRYLLERGRTYNSSGEKEKARKFFLQAFELSGQNKEDYYEIDAAHMLGIIGTTEEQLNWNLRTIELINKTKDERSKKWLGSLYNNIGWSYHDAGNFEKALEYFEKCLEWNLDNDSSLNISVAKWSVARCKRSLKRTNEALDEQLAIEKENKEKGIKEDGYNYEEIGECLYELGKTDEAKPYFAKAHKLLTDDKWIDPVRLERLKNLS